MAAMATSTDLSQGKIRQNESVTESFECVNCYDLREQLKLITQELESARTIISLLQEERNNSTDMQTTLDYPLQDKSPANAQNEEDLTWNPAKSKTTKKNTKTSQPKQVAEIPIPLDNRFQTLDNLNENQDCVPSAVNKPQVFQGKVTNTVKNISIPPRNENKINYDRYSKIPTIINGIVRHSEKQTIKPVQPKILISKYKKNNKHTRKVLLIGDSHFKEITTKGKEYLGTSVGFTGYVKPGATVEQIFDSQKTELECLGKEDLVVINGGANNMGNNPRRITNALVPLLQFAQNCANTNVLMVNIPIRHDHPINFQINRKIKNFNDNLSKRIRHFKHAHLLSMQTDRRYFTKHGQHFNKIGKERLAKDLAFTINEVFSNTTKNSEQIYPLSWKEEGMPQDKLVGPLAKQQCNIYTDKDGHFPPLSCTNNRKNVPNTSCETVCKPDEVQETIRLDQTLRTSNRQNKATIPRNNDFLW